MADPDKLTPADPRDIADALAFALRFDGRKRVHSADELMSAIVAKRRCASAIATCGRVGGIEITAGYGLGVDTRTFRTIGRGPTR